MIISDHHHGGVDIPDIQYYPRSFYDRHHFESSCKIYRFSLGADMCKPMISDMWEMWRCWCPILSRHRRVGGEAANAAPHWNVQVKNPHSTHPVNQCFMLHVLLSLKTKNMAFAFKRFDIYLWDEGEAANTARHWNVHVSNATTRSPKLRSEYDWFLSSSWWLW